MKANSSHQPFFGAMGCTSAIVFTCFGAAYGTAKSGVGISAMGVLRPDLIVKSMPYQEQCHIDTLLNMTIDIVPVIMAGIIGIYGLVVSVLISDDLKQGMALYTGFIQLGAGLSVGLAGLAAGYALSFFHFCPNASSPLVTVARKDAYSDAQIRNWHRR